MLARDLRGDQGLPVLRHHGHVFGDVLKFDLDGLRGWDLSGFHLCGLRLGSKQDVLVLHHHPLLLKVRGRDWYVNRCLLADKGGLNGDGLRAGHALLEGLA